MPFCTTFPALLALTLMAAALHVRGEGQDTFLPYGTDAGDVSSGYNLYFGPPKFVFMGISNYLTPGSGSLVVTSGNFGILALCCKMQKRGGNLWRRQSSTKAELKKVRELARKYAEFGSCYNPAWVVVATWDNFGTNTEAGGNTFQIVAASDGKKSFVLIDYRSVSSGAVGNKATISRVPGEYNILSKYNLASVTDLPNNSNINVTGQFLFRVDQKEVQEPTPLPGEDVTCKTQCFQGECIVCKPDEFFSRGQQKCLSKTKCKGKVVEGECRPFMCRPNEFFSLSKNRCVSALDCGFCGKVGSYSEYQGVWWEGPGRHIRSRITKSNATTAREECKAQCSADVFCVAFNLKDTAVDTTCTLLPSFFDTGEFKYNQDNVTFFHKHCI